MFQGTLGVKFVVLGLGSTILILFYFFCIKVVKLGTKFNNFAPKVGFCQPDVLMMTITCPVVSTRWNLWQFPKGSRWPVQPGCSRCLGALGQQPKIVQSILPFLSQTQNILTFWKIQVTTLLLRQFYSNTFSLHDQKSHWLVLKLWMVQKEWFE